VPWLNLQKKLQVDEDSEDEKPRRKKVNKAAELFSDSASDEESDAVVKCVLRRYWYGFAEVG
jgi:hypothetical protein